MHPSLARMLIASWRPARRQVAEDRHRHARSSDRLGHGRSRRSPARRGRAGGGGDTWAGPSPLKLKRRTPTAGTQRAGDPTAPSALEQALGGLEGHRIESSGRWATTQASGRRGRPDEKRLVAGTCASTKSHRARRIQTKDAQLDQARSSGPAHAARPEGGRGTVKEANILDDASALTDTKKAPRRPRGQHRKSKNPAGASAAIRPAFPQTIDVMDNPAAQPIRGGHGRDAHLAGTTAPASEPQDLRVPENLRQRPELRQRSSGTT